MLTTVHRHLDRLFYDVDYRSRKLDTCQIFVVKAIVFRQHPDSKHVSHAPLLPNKNYITRLKSNEKKTTRNVTSSARLLPIYQNFQRHFCTI